MIVNWNAKATKFFFFGQIQITTKNLI
ncbi:hypothetical protein CGSHi3655_03556 [Haemophilus influenzae 3655]|uniref:Uncharacterized protein n=1 Tax=Haemophilus influenzae (strain NTHi 3655) TaxID=375177 RepID=A0A0H3PCB0_HAEI3|nr:hypothetical protein CGSHi3655_03556 [Haemophilus influenzae 3655]